jgi:hypothetical protein
VPTSCKLAKQWPTSLSIGQIKATRLVIRRAGLAARTRYSAVWTTLWCAAAGAVSYAAAAAPGTAGRFGVWQLAGLNTPLITGGVAMTAALGAATWTLARSRRRRYLR